MDKVKIIISPVITVSPVIKVTFNISTVVKIIVKVIKRIKNRRVKNVETLEDKP